MPYIRVIPRDLFNESKLLKCLGQVVLAIETGKAPQGMGYEQLEDTGFEVVQTPSTGSLWCPNIVFTYGHETLALCTAYNSRDAYPLYVETDTGEELRVLNDDGTFAETFLEFLKTLPIEG